MIDQFSTIVLGLDISSTTIGWIILDGNAVRDFGEAQFKHSDINDRCRMARAYAYTVLLLYPDIDVAAMETPVLRHFRKGTNIHSLIPQCFVQGAVRALLSEKGILVCDVAPAAGKKALAGIGVASKQDMMDAAEHYGVRGEHASDALGIAKAAIGQVERSV